MRTVRFGLIGLGHHVRRYARHLAAGEVAGASLAIVCRRNRGEGEAVARDLGVSFTDDYRRILADPGVEAVAIVVPCDLHPRIVPEALEAGKAVLVEKPLAPSARAARTILEAASRSPMPAMVAQTLRFNTVVRACRERRGDLGPIRFISLSQRFEPSPGGWPDDPSAGGILRNTGVHAFDLVRHLTGLEAEEASCFKTIPAEGRMEDCFASILRLTGEVLSTVDNARTTASRSGRIELVAEGGQLAGDLVHHRLLEIKGTRMSEVALPPPAHTVRECLEAFAAAVRGEGPVPIPLMEGLRAVEIVDACRMSAETGLPRRVERKP